MIEVANQECLSQFLLTRLNEKITQCLLEARQMISNMLDHIQNSSTNMISESQ